MWASTYHPCRILGQNSNGPNIRNPNQPYEWRATDYGMTMTQVPRVWERVRWAYIFRRCVVTVYWHVMPWTNVSRLQWSISVSTWLNPRFYSNCQAMAFISEKYAFGKVDYAVPQVIDLGDSLCSCSWVTATQIGDDFHSLIRIFFCVSYCRLLPRVVPPRYIRYSGWP